MKSFLIGTVLFFVIFGIVGAVCYTLHLETMRSTSAAGLRIINSYYSENISEVNVVIERALADDVITEDEYCHIYRIRQNILEAKKKVENMEKLKAAILRARPAP